MGAGTQTPAITTSALNAESLPSRQIIFMTFFVDDSLVFISNIVASLKNCFSSHRVDIRVCIPLSPQIEMSKLVERLKPSLPSLYGSNSLSCFTSPSSGSPGRSGSHLLSTVSFLLCLSCLFWFCPSAAMPVDGLLTLAVVLFDFQF